MDMFQLGAALIPDSAVIPLLHALYMWDFESDIEGAKSFIASLSGRLDELPWDMQRLLLDMSWRFSDAKFQEQVFKARLAALHDVWCQCHVLLVSLWKHLASERCQS